MKATAYWHLLRWLGPWAAQERAPGGIERRELLVAPRGAGDRPFPAWLYLPKRRPAGAYLIAPGVHFNGPADPRLDRLCRVLATAGFVVLSPFLPDYLALTVRPSVINDLERALACLRSEPAANKLRPGIFSISFGSLPALALAGRLSDQLNGVIVFGGYANFDATAAFLLTGNHDGKVHERHDPTNQAVVFINILPYLPEPPHNAAALAQAWFDFARATWNQPEMRSRDRMRQVAAELAATITNSDRGLFMRGCGLEPGGVELWRQAVVRGRALWDALDVRGYVKGVRCPVYLVHGYDDDVIPYSQMEALRAALPPGVVAGAYLTGWYGHTTRANLRDLARMAPALTREGITMLRILRALAVVPSSARP